MGSGDFQLLEDTVAAHHSIWRISLENDNSGPAHVRALELQLRESAVPRRAKMRRFYRQEKKIPGEDDQELIEQRCNI